MDVTHLYLILLCHFIKQNQKLWYSPETFRLSFYSIQGVPQKIWAQSEQGKFWFQLKISKIRVWLNFGKALELILDLQEGEDLKHGS